MNLTVEDLIQKLQEFPATASVAIYSQEYDGYVQLTDADEIYYSENYDEVRFIA